MIGQYAGKNPIIMTPSHLLLKLQVRKHRVDNAALQICVVAAPSLRGRCVDIHTEFVVSIPSALSFSVVCNLEIVELHTAFLAH
jgi:hypothetical protein